MYKTQETEYLPEYEEYGFVPVDPEIIAKALILQLKSYRGSKDNISIRKLFELFGCADDYAAKNIQYNVDDGLVLKCFCYILKKVNTNPDIYINVYTQTHTHTHTHTHRHTHTDTRTQTHTDTHTHTHTDIQ